MEILLAYEPGWAISDSGTPATVEQVSSNIDTIKNVTNDLLKREIPCLYGGSVNAENCEQFAKCKNLDGLFIGKAAWDVQNFAYDPFVSTDCLNSPCNQDLTVGVEKHLSGSMRKDPFPNQPRGFSQSWTLERIIAISKTAPKTISWIDTATPIRFIRLVIRPITSIAPSKPETDPRPQLERSRQGSLRRTLLNIAFAHGGVHRKQPAYLQ